MTDIVEVLRNYQRWIKAGQGSEVSIEIDDIDGDETFGVAADEIEKLRAENKSLRGSFNRLLATSRASSNAQ